jgi:hypothetical protein
MIEGWNSARQADGFGQKLKSSLVAQFVLAANHFCKIFWDTCVAGALVINEADKCSSKRAMSLGLARLIIELILRRSRAPDLVMTSVL